MGLDRRAWRLLPSEVIVWSGRRTPGMPHSRRWLLLPLLFSALTIVSAAFSGLLLIEKMPGVGKMVGLATMFLTMGVASILAPRYLVDRCEYLVTDKRILWRRGKLLRSMERRGITYGRVIWHPSVTSVGHVELVRAVPFGPLARRQRIVFQDVQEPIQTLAIIRGGQLGPHAEDRDVPFSERLDQGESLLWGGHPVGWLLGWREVATAIGGVGITALGLQYGIRAAQLLLGLEELGLLVKTWEWMLLFVAVLTTWLLILAIGLGLLWHGLFRARALGRATEYVLTDRRVLIRRGLTELSLDRKRIVDVAETRTLSGHRHLFLLLDAPDSRALADSGALGPLLPSRDEVPPVFFDLPDVARVKKLLLAEVPYQVSTQPQR